MEGRDNGKFLEEGGEGNADAHTQRFLEWALWPNRMCFQKQKSKDCF